MANTSVARLSVALSSSCSLTNLEKSQINRPNGVRLGSNFLQGSKKNSFCKICCPQGASKFTAFFRFGSRGLDAEGAGIYGSQGRDDFDRDDVEQYFNYMGMLASEGSYDKMEALLESGIHPVDILLLLAATEGDRPKIQELLNAGAKSDVTDTQGNTALDRAQSDEIRKLIEAGPTKVRA